MRLIFHWYAPEAQASFGVLSRGEERERLDMPCGIVSCAALGFARACVRFARACVRDSQMAANQLIS